MSTEAAVVFLGGHPMFLGKDDIQLGVSHNFPFNSPINLMRSKTDGRL